MKKVSVSAIIALAIIVINACGPDKKSSTASNNDIDKNPAMNNPDKFAWELFIEINKPANKSKPDSSTLWETWALARNVFKNPNHPPSWEDAGKSDSTLKTMDFLPVQQQRISKFLQNELGANFSPDEPSSRIGGLSETRFNKPVYDFIVKHDLYYQEGIEKYIADKKILDLPISAMEIKAVWDTIKPENKDNYHYVIQTDSKGKKVYWGLTGLHIISKDIPQWTWATFEHINNPRLKEVDKVEALRSRDNFGRVNGKISKDLEELFSKNDMPKVWQNYILRGTQTNFTSTNGTVSFLANTRTENHFIYSSSCITCHSRATIGSTLIFSDLPKGVQDSIKFAKIPNNKFDAEHYFNSLGFIEKVLIEPDPITKEKIIMYTGFPRPEWFDVTYSSGKKETLKQLDFMWSFTRALRRTPYKEK